MKRLVEQQKELAALKKRLKTVFVNYGEEYLTGFIRALKVNDYVILSGFSSGGKRDALLKEWGIIRDIPVKDKLHTKQDVIDFLSDKKPTHYDNTNGSLYKFCEDKKLNSYEFDIIKRVMRCRKKGVFLEDLQKTKVLIDLYIKEHGK